MSSSFTSPLAESLSEGLLERFIRYAQVDTQSKVDREQSPSTPGQLDLQRILARELGELGLQDVELDQYGYTYATLPANVEGAPVIGLIAHVDVSPDAPAENVKPLVHRDYDGGVIELPLNGTRLDPDAIPELRDKVGHDLISSSGDTLLGADDKAGVAAIMTCVAHLAANPELPRPTLKVAFTPDEEIGEGATLFDIEKFDARCAYTVDGSALGELDEETFSALEARIRIDGIGIHPGHATGKLVSALKVAAEMVTALPTSRLTPDTTSGREGFLHPVTFVGGSDTAEVRVIVRDFDEQLLASHAELLRKTAEETVARHPGATLHFELLRQYRNMREYIDADPDVMAAAREAFAAEGITPVSEPVRGGTDGSRLSEMGLPTPNIFDGGHEYHSVREWASLQEMAASAATLVRLAEVWSARS